MTTTNAESQTDQKIDRRRKYSNKEESKEAKKAQNMVSYHKTKSNLAKFHCDLCDRDYQYHSKSGHLRSVGHLRIKNKLNAKLNSQSNAPSE